jgi:hypothetical protein
MARRIWQKIDKFTLQLHESMLIAIFFCIFFALPSATAANIFNADTVTKIDNFLLQSDSNGVKNIDKLGWTLSDPTTWEGTRWGNFPSDTSGISELLNIDISSKNLHGNLDLSDSILLGSLLCDNNELERLDVSNSPSLYRVSVSKNKLSDINLSNCNIREINCDNNQLTNLFLQNFTFLTDLNFHNNDLTHLDLSGCISLSNVRAYHNPLLQAVISPSHFQYGLHEFYAHDTSLDLSFLRALPANTITYSEGEYTITEWDRYNFQVKVKSTQGGFVDIRYILNESDPGYGPLELHFLALSDHGYSLLAFEDLNNLSVPRFIPPVYAAPGSTLVQVGTNIFVADIYARELSFTAIFQLDVSARPAPLPLPKTGDFFPFEMLIVMVLLLLATSGLLALKRRLNNSKQSA